MRALQDSDLSEFMSPIRERRIIARANALCRADGYDPDETTMDHGAPQRWEHYRSAAETLER